MNKLLTISIAAYNVSSYINDTLDSLIDAEIIDYLEVFVIDDGGNDNTLEIAKEYENKFPNSIHTIHKTNGGYGSTVNYSIEHSTGKYFKLLDGDDWFDKNGLRNLINILKSTESDVVVTPFYIGPDKDSMKLNKRKWMNLNGVQKNVKDIHDTSFPMWCITYRTECLKKANLLLPEKRLYTDQLYNAIPFEFVNTVLFCSIPVYSYRFGHTGQSMSKISRYKHVQDAIDVSIDLCNFCNLERIKYCNSRNIILHRSGASCGFAFGSLLLIPEKKERRIKIKEYSNKLKKTNKDVYKQFVKMGKAGKALFMMQFTNFYGTSLIRKFVPNL